MLHLVMKMETNARNNVFKTTQATNKVPLLLFKVKVDGEKFDRRF